ncbi:MAG: hypothetical protein ACO2PN_08535 [Pyrobaculum sp.]
MSIRDVTKELNCKNYAVLKAALEILLAPHAEGTYQTTHITKYIYRHNNITMPNITSP